MPGEVEAAIYKHPAISAAPVIGVPDEAEGETHSGKIKKPSYAKGLL
ncbi:TPA: hypothetical protein ACIZCU_000328 [Legionella pneumophila]|nr:MULTISPECIES: hypothetical protein [Legionella]MCW8395351.1 hypothetical protein [Legionella sp. PATHC039]